MGKIFHGTVMKMYLNFLLLIDNALWFGENVLVRCKTE